MPPIASCCKNSNAVKPATRSGGKRHRTQVAGRVRALRGARRPRPAASRVAAQRFSLAGSGTTGSSPATGTVAMMTFGAFPHPTQIILQTLEGASHSTSPSGCASLECLVLSALRSPLSTDSVRGCIVGIAARSVISRVENRTDLRHAAADGCFDAVSQSHVGHATSLASAAHLDEHGVFSDVDQPHEAAVLSHCGVDLSIQHGLYSLADHFRRRQGRSDRLADSRLPGSEMLTDRGPNLLSQVTPITEAVLVDGDLVVRK